MARSLRERAPWHIWLIGALSFVWNAFGAFDYYMTQTRNAAYLSAFTPEQRAYFESFPAWVEAFWAIGVWGAVAGSVALLLRWRHAVSFFGASLLGLIVTTIWQFLLTDVNPLEILHREAVYFIIAIWIIAIALLYYARRQEAAGRLR
jgi:hypothetical protein